MLKRVLGAMRVVTDHSPFLRTLFHHHLSHDIIQTALKAQHTIQCQATGTIIWLRIMTPDTEPGGHFLPRAHSEKKSLTLQEPGHSISDSAMYNHTHSLQQPLAKYLLNLSLQHFSYQPMIQLVSQDPTWLLRNKAAVVEVLLILLHLV
jgi:hypothetical protein